jgi:hypothetical protein
VARLKAKAATTLKKVASRFPSHSPLSTPAVNPAPVKLFLSSEWRLVTMNAGLAIDLRRSKTDMKGKFLLALMLASGMAFAQSGGTGPGYQQQPSTQQTQPSTGQSNQSPTSAGQSSLSGCLKGSDGAWVLIAEGQSTPVTGDSSTLAPHNGHQVQVKGRQASDGSFQVTDIVMIADTCTKQ